MNMVFSYTQQLTFKKVVAVVMAIAPVVVVATAVVKGVMAVVRVDMVAEAKVVSFDSILLSPSMTKPQY